MNIEVRKPTAEEIQLAKSWPIWSKEPSQFPWQYAERETCLILSGQAHVTSVDGATIEFGAGDWVVFPSGLDCTWTVQETIRKHYNFGEY
jgi:uncharacterized protein